MHATASAFPEVISSTLFPSLDARDFLKRTPHRDKRPVVEKSPAICECGSRGGRISDRD